MLRVCAGCSPRVQVLAVPLVDTRRLSRHRQRRQPPTFRPTVLWCSSGQRQHQIPITAIRICSTFVQPATTVRNLGVFVDTDVSMKAHITATVRSCFAALRLVRSVRRCLPHQALLTLIRALVVSKVDYCCSVLAAGSPAISLTGSSQF